MYYINKGFLYRTESSYRCEQMEFWNGEKKRIEQKIITCQVSQKCQLRQTGRNFREIQQPCRLYEFYVFCGNFHSGKISAWNQMTGWGRRTLLIRRARSREYELNEEQNNGNLVPTSMSINLFVSPNLLRYLHFTSTSQISCKFLFWTLVTWNHAREVIQVNVLHHGQKQTCWYYCVKSSESDFITSILQIRKLDTACLKLFG